MAFDFPASPSVGQTYAPSGGPLYTWDGVKWIASASAVAADTYTSFINKLRNGTFDVWQRPFPISATVGGVYTADGWVVAPSGAAVSVTRIANGRPSPSTLYALSITGATSVTAVTALQRIEGSIAQQMAGQRITFQAWIFNNTGGTITPTLTTQVAGSLDNFSSPTTDINNVSLQPCLNGVWTRVAYTSGISGNAGLGYLVALNFGNNFSTSAKSVAIAEADVRVVAAATPIGINASPPTAEMRPIAIEQMLCERHFRWLGFNHNWVATAGGFGNNIDIYFPTMRATPTIGANVADPNTTQTAANQSTNGWGNITPYSASPYTVAVAAGNVTLLGYRAPASAEL